MTEHRQKQLREAKRTQRQRDREAGLALYQAKLPRPLVERLKTGLKHESFTQAFKNFLEHELLAIADYPQLELLCWNIKAPFLTREDAFRIYERNWRLVDEDSLTPCERTLIAQLAEEFGRGLINA